DLCSNATPLTSSTTCSTVAGDLQDATGTGSPSGGCVGATSPTNDVWYTFTATSTNATITVSGLGNSLNAATTYIELFSGTCGSLTSITCQTVATSLVRTTLTVGATYYVRVYVTGGTSSSPPKRNFTICLVSSSNDEPTSATSLTPNLLCSNTAGSLLLATMSTGLPAGCETAGNHWDVWYKFTAANTTSTITLSSQGANFTNPEIQLYSGTPGSLTSLQCGTTTLAASSLTIGTTYYVRVSNVGPSAPSGTVTFNICVTYPPPPPSNDDCNNSISLISNTTCSNTASSIVGATASASIPLGCAAAGTYYDAWFSFAAASASQTITISSRGTNFSNPSIQLYSGSCGSLSSVGCGTTTLTATGLTIGATYFVRVSNAGTAVNASGDFNICVTHPAPVIPSIDYSKSYINVTKGSTGGTVNPGDTLEMRATMVIKSGTVDSLSFTDTLFNTKGLGLIPGSISLRTNEGKIYGSAFTDAFDGDQGWYTTNGLDTVVHINFGAGASSTKRGSLSSTSRPSVFGSTCIIMATYRVVVYAPYDTKVNFKTGALTYKTSAINTVTFAPNNLVVYQSPGLCPNAVSATNAVGAENNGTFGSALVQNRAASPYTTYVYSTFSTAGGPQDYYYGIANNTSSKYTAVTTWPKPDNGGYRVFSQWDITGDHTNASNPLKGNPPCDNTKPISPTNPCGYMLVVNSAYKADTAFTYNVANLCPNTYYELSAWFKNICYKCGCDSTGAGSGAAGYIPTALGDSSGVRPNIAFDVNGTDYYTTGDIKYTGTTPTGSDSTNQWVKRGFVYLTGPSETSFRLTLRNNAPGGGGNDWALDDIAVATCLPNMKYSPSLNPTVCQTNPITINDTIRSYFNTYQNYKWQRSTDNGSTWTDVGVSGTATPVLNGSEWQYITSYTVPSSATNAADSGNRYRVVVSSTAGNLGNSSCQVTDGISLISLNVLNCGLPLKTDLLSFNGKLVNNHSSLSWSTSREDEPVHFTVERSNDGVNFYRIGTVNGNRNAMAETNYYAFTDSAVVGNKTKYRVSMINNRAQAKYSRIIQLGSEPETFTVNVLVNPFSKDLLFDVGVNGDSKINVILLDAAGNAVKRQTHTAYSGSNSFSMPNTAVLPASIYILQVQYKDKTISKKVIKK
ncbi:MAG: T9SS type A sorting domain-containing protein, partial [Flavisolibacter sp.]